MFNNRTTDHNHSIDLKNVLTKMQVDDPNNTIYVAPKDIIQNKLDFFYLPYNKDLSISKGVTLEDHEDI